MSLKNEALKAVLKDEQQKIAKAILQREECQKALREEPSAFLTNEYLKNAQIIYELSVSLSEITDKIEKL